MKWKQQQGVYNLQKEHLNVQLWREVFMLAEQQLPINCQPLQGTCDNFQPVGVFFLPYLMQNLILSNHQNSDLKKLPHIVTSIT